jgi:hypothetical protein
MADKSALFKSLLARGLYNIGQGTSKIKGLLNRPQAARAGGLLTQPTEE